MLSQRLLVIAILLPVGVFLVAIGGIPLYIFFSLILALSVWEYGNLFEKGGWKPWKLLAIISVIGIALLRSFYQFQYAPELVALITMSAMAFHLIQYEKGRSEAAVDFCITLGGVLYIGWLGSYLISLRNLPDGLWWFFLVLPSAWAGDSMAYLIGSRWGKTPLAPRLSPRKTREGYFAGILGAIIGGLIMAAIFQQYAPSITLLRGAVTGLVMGAITPLGDLGESMFKRMVGAKDSSNLLPGHGGVFDRIDSWIWAGVLGFYLVTYFWL